MEAQKIFGDEQTGSVYWLDEGTVYQAPMNNDDTCNLDSYAQVEAWETPADEARIRAKLS